MNKKDAEAMSDFIYDGIVNYLLPDLAQGPIMREGTQEVSVLHTAMIMLAARNTIEMLLDAVEDIGEERNDAEAQLTTALNRIVELEGRLARGYGQ